MPKVFISTLPFGDRDSTPIHLLESAGIEYLINPIGRKLTENELAEIIEEFDVLIAGTEPITKLVMERAKKLKHISRVGIGLDNVDLIFAKKKAIRVSYTPDAPTEAVSDLTIGLMLDLLRHIHISNSQIHQKKWYRFFGRRLSEVTIGLIGLGRIGSSVLRKLQGFGVNEILVNDIKPDLYLAKNFNIRWVEKEEIYRNADVISLHLPLNLKTRNMITKKELSLFKSDAILINTARGGIVNEWDLYEVLKDRKLGGAAVDVFELEPYSGPLQELERCILTAHLGSMSVDCRTRMEIESTEEAIRFLKGEPLQNEVPEEEYSN